MRKGEGGGKRASSFYLPWSYQDYTLGPHPSTTPQYHTLVLHQGEGKERFVILPSMELPGSSTRVVLG